MSDLLTLPRDIEPADFFRLVEQTLADEVAPPDAPPDRAVIHLDGTPGGAWNLGFSEGRFHVAEGPAEGAPLQLTASTDDWREFVAGRLRDLVSEHVDVNLLDPRNIAHLYRHQDKVEMIKAFSGDIRFVVEDPSESRDYQAVVTLGGKAPDVANPATTIRITLDDLLALVRGESNLQEAFFSGKLRLEGDMNLAMSLMALAAS